MRGLINSFTNSHTPQKEDPVLLPADTMSLTFKIPKKKKQGAELETDSVVMQSPLSRLQDSASVDTSGWGVANGGVASRATANRVHAGKGLTSRGAKQRPGVKDMQSVMRTLLGLDKPADNPRKRTAEGSRRDGQSVGTPPAQHVTSNGWRPRRASDRLLCAVSEEESHSAADSIVSVSSTDSPGRTGESSRHSHRAAREAPFRWHSSSSNSPSPPHVRAASPSLPSASPPPPPPPILSTSLAPRRTGGGRPGGGSLSLAARRPLRDYTRASAVSSRLGKPPTEPIVLSSEEEDAETSEGSGRVRDAAGTTQHKRRAREMSSRASRATESCPEGLRPIESSPEGYKTADTSPESPSAEETSTEASGTLETSPEASSSRVQADSSAMELQFSRLLLGGLSAQAQGNVLITEDGINVPLKDPHSDSEECLSVCVVTSQLRGYGVWEKGVATASQAPSLLFLWVTDSQAGLLQTELSVLQPITASQGACPFLLLELSCPLAALQAALLRSLLDTGGTAQSVSVSHALSMVHKHPHLLEMLRHNTTGMSSRLRSRVTPGLITRLIQYPLTPGKGRISVTTEDLSCLDEGEFLNDVIIDFYLKFLLLERSGSLSERCHVFSSFFYRQLTKRRTTEEEPQPLDRVGRHQRVKTWTRNVDIFDKDFLFVPVNQESHWYLLVVCFPGLQEEIWSSCESSPHEEQEVKRPRLRTGLRARGHETISTPPECTRLGWKGETALKRPCILVMDSLKRSCRENVCKLLRDYLCVEWTQRRHTHRLYTTDNMRSCNVRLPLQDNSSDCGLYLLQYVETFLQNPVVNFDLPVCLERWFPRQQVRRKREEIRSLVMDMHRNHTQQNHTSDAPEPHPTQPHLRSTGLNQFCVPRNQSKPVHTGPRNQAKPVPVRFRFSDSLVQYL